MEHLTSFIVFGDADEGERTKGTGLVRIKDAAKLIGVHRNTLRNMVERGELPPPVRVTARQVGWQFETLRHWLDTRGAAPAWKVNEVKARRHKRLMGEK